MSRLVDDKFTNSDQVLKLRICSTKKYRIIRLLFFLFSVVYILLSLLIMQYLWATYSGEDFLDAVPPQSLTCISVLILVYTIAISLYLLGWMASEPCVISKLVENSDELNLVISSDTKIVLYSFLGLEKLGRIQSKGLDNFEIFADFNREHQKRQILNFAQANNLLVEKLQFR